MPALRIEFNITDGATPAAKIISGSMRCTRLPLVMECNVSKRMLDYRARTAARREDRKLLASLRSGRLLVITSAQWVRLLDVLPKRCWPPQVVAAIQ